LILDAGCWILDAGCCWIKVKGERLESLEAWRLEGLNIPASQPPSFLASYFCLSTINYELSGVSLLSHMKLH
jgi:hypothetical protein